MIYCWSCGAPMKLRAGSAASHFWGCVRYPDCRGIVYAYRGGAPREVRPQDGLLAQERIAKAKDLAIERWQRLWDSARIDRDGFYERFFATLDADTLLDVGEVRRLYA